VAGGTLLEQGIKVICVSKSTISRPIIIGSMGMFVLGWAWGKKGMEK